MAPADQVPPRQEDTVGRSLGRFSLRVGIGTLLAVAVLYFGFRGQVRPVADGSSETAASEVLAPAVEGAEPGPAVGTAAEGEAPTGAPEVVASTAAGPRPLGPVAAALEKRYLAGGLAEVRRSFAACPGGDLRRVAWVDEAQRVRKLLRERPGGVTVEEWFDEAGKLREARTRIVNGGATWWRWATVGEEGKLAAEEQGTLPAGLAPPALVREDSTRAFFAPPGCERAP